MKIGELVNQTHVPKETIHYYVREGLLPRPRKLGKTSPTAMKDTWGEFALSKNFKTNAFFRYP